MKKIATQLLASVTLLLTLFPNNKISAQTTVVLPGSFQSELGCTGDWMPDCDATRLIQTSTNTWEGTFAMPGGDWEFKVAYDNSWSENYGLYGVLYGANIPLSLSATTLVHFSFSSLTHLVDISFPNPPGVPFSVVLAGNFQSEVGCPGDWQPDCNATGLTYDQDAKLWYGILRIPQGNWEYKVTIDNSWSENYGQGGVPNGPNIPLTVSSDKKILFHYNHETHIVTHSLVNYSVILAGSFQSELGCPGDWQPDCPMSGLTFDAPNNLWKREVVLPAGSWEFKVALDGSWNENYGDGGELNGPNIVLNLTLPSLVSFVFDPETHLTTYTIKPQTVVLPGTFQSELGCTADWMPDCDNTRFTYDIINNVWTGTYEIPAGDWEYKVALYNSWDENYGLYGLRNGPNIQLHLELPANITFRYEPLSHLVTLFYNSTGLCVTAFYDPNANGYKDYDENILMEGVAFDLSGAANAIQYSGSDGKTCFTNLKQGVYTVQETAPTGYLASNLDSQSVYLTQPQALNFGVVCLGSAGARNIGYWMNKQGKAKFDSLADWQQGYIMSTLRYFILRNQDGSDFDPWNYEQLMTWMQRGNAKNMAYKLSVELAVLYLNSEIEMLGNRAIYTPGIIYWGLPADFMNVYTVVWYMNQQLYSNPSSFGTDANRTQLESLVDILENANSDLSFVQLQPCNEEAVTSAKSRLLVEASAKSTSVLIWPNPSSRHFNLQLTNCKGIDKIQIRIIDMAGKQVYSMTGNGKKTYQFGEGLAPGLYFVELTQNGQRFTTKVVKR